MEMKHIKEGKRVAFIRRNGEPAAGRVNSVVESRSGMWVWVNTAPAKAPAAIAKVRPSELSPA